MHQDRWSRVSRQALVRARREFFAALRVAMARPVVLVHRATVPCWLDRGGRLNHLTIYPYLEPDRTSPTAPLVTRVAVNYYTTDISLADVGRLRRGLGHRLRVNHVYAAGRLVAVPAIHRETDWCLELSTLPEELPSFGPWLARLLDAHDSGQLDGMPQAPHPSRANHPHVLAWSYVWTVTAEERASAYFSSRRAR